VNYLGKGVRRTEQYGLKNDDPDKRIPVGVLVLGALRRRWMHQLAQRRAAQEPGHCKWRGPDYQPDTRTGFIFTNPSDGKPMNPRSVDRQFASIRDRAGLDVERFHALRHAFTTLLRSSGTRDRVAQTMTGHRDPAMLDYYDDPMESEKVAAAQRLDARLRGLLGPAAG
jgi:integrase